jgi:hypothetical protein
MILGIIKTLFIMLIALPFIYIVTDVLIDIFKRTFGFYQKIAKPAIISIFSAIIKP